MPRGDFPTPPSTLVIACGALARESVDLKRANGWRHKGFHWNLLEWPPCHINQLGAPSKMVERK